jgi:hypothetical protein
MSSKKLTAVLAGTAATLLVALALVGSLPQPTAPVAPAAPVPPQAPVTANDCPPGQVPVAPGARTCIPDLALTLPVTERTGGAECPPGLAPVAPGSRTCIPDRTVAQPATKPSSEATAHVSIRHGYTVVLPDDQWSVREVPGEWKLGDTFDPRSSGVDYLVHQGAPAYRHDVFLNSQGYVGATRLDSFHGWLSTYQAITASEFPHCTVTGDYLGDYETGIIDGEEARIITAVCNGDRWAEAVWQRGARAYVLRVGEESRSEVAIDPRDEIDAWLARISMTD